MFEIHKTQFMNLNHINFGNCLSLLSQFAENTSMGVDKRASLMLVLIDSRALN